MPTSLSLFFGKCNHSSHAEIAMKLSAHHKNPAPDNVSGFADALERATAKGEIHWGLTFAAGALVAAYEMRGGCSSRDQENPHIIIHAIASVMLAPAQVVEGILWRKSQFTPKLVGNESIQPGAFIDFVEMGQCLTGEQDASSSRAFHCRPIDVVQQSFNEVAGWGEIFQPLLILNADGRAAEFVSESYGGDIHFALLQGLVAGEFGGLVTSPGKLHAFPQKPVEDVLRLGIADLPHRGVERGLTKAFLEEAGKMQQFVGHDGVEHTHAAFIEDAEDGFALPKLAREAAAQSFVAGWQFH